MLILFQALNSHHLGMTSSKFVRILHDRHILSSVLLIELFKCHCDSRSGNRFDQFFFPVFLFPCIFLLARFAYCLPIIFEYFRKFNWIDCTWEHLWHLCSSLSLFIFDFIQNLFNIMNDFSLIFFFVTIIG